VRQREFISLLDGAAVGWQFAASAQQTAKIARIGVLSDQSPALSSLDLAPFEKGLRELGYAEGQNVAMERRDAHGKHGALPHMAAELIHARSDAILAIGTSAARAAKEASSTIPVVFVRVGDPVASGLVRSIASPGGNLTGLTLLTIDLTAKRLELLVQSVKGIRRVGVLLEPAFATAASQLRELERAAQSLGIDLKVVHVRAPNELDAAISTMIAERVGALVVTASILFTENRSQLRQLALKARIPAIAVRREFPDAGLFMSYGSSFAAMFQRAAAYMDKILKGAKPADLPVEQPDRIEMVINIRTARVLGISLSPEVLARADEIIE
jgi:putative ABC transport system substrate-binding protein